MRELETTYLFKYISERCACQCLCEKSFELTYKRTLQKLK